MRASGRENRASDDTKLAKTSTIVDGARTGMTVEALDILRSD
jgi:hypothetical protein